MKKWPIISIAGLLSTGFVSPAGSEPWTLPKGDVYATASLLGTRSRSMFSDSSDRVSFLNNGLSRVASVTLDGAYGLTDALTVSATVPVLFYRLRDDFVQEKGTSLGDVRVLTRYRLFNRSFVSSVEAALKLPTATATDPTRIQVGEGQVDIDFIWSLGWGALPVYASLDLGYRVRRRNGENGLKPGDEVLFRTGGDYRLSDRLSAGLALDGFWGQTGNSNTFGLKIRNANSARRLVAFVPGVTYRLTDRIGLDLRATFPVLGRNYYAGSLFTAGLSFSSSQVGLAGRAAQVPTPRGGSCCSIQ